MGKIKPWESVLNSMCMYQTFLWFKFSFAQKVLSILEKLISEEEDKN